MQESNPTSHKQDSDLYNIPFHTPLALVIDRCHGFILLKNLATKIKTEMYSIAVEKEDKSLHMANEPQVAWCSPQQADKVMREILNNPTYNKATKDWYEEE